MTVQINGANGLTFPDTSSQAVASKVLQVVNNTVQQGSTTYFATSSTALVSTGFSVTITPKFATSRIFLLCNFTLETATTNTMVGLTIFKNNTTNLASGGTTGIMSALRNNAGVVDCGMALTYMDSPATTSATTYTVYMSSSNLTSSFGVNSTGNANALSFTAIEIAP